MPFSLNPVGGFWLVAVVAMALLGLCAVRPSIVLAPRRRATLVALRVAAILMLLFAMLRPEIVQTRVETLRAALLVLLDSSKSMTVEDSLAGRSRWGAGVDLLGHSKGSLDKLAAHCDVRAYRFDDTLRPVTDLARLSTVTPDGDSTTLGRSLMELLDNEASERLLGVIVLSDGAQRAAPGADLAPQAAARRYAVEDVPIFPFCYGTPAGGAKADVAIDDLVASESVFAGTPTSVTGLLRVRGYPNRTLTVQLLWEDDAGEMQPVDAVQIAAGPAAETYPINLQHTPQALGERRVQLLIQPQEGEALTNNNSQTTYVTVREGGVKVLYLAGAKRIGGFPGVEQRFVRGALASSPDISVTLRRINYEPSRADMINELTASKYDVYLLDDLDVEAMNRDSWTELAERIRRGAGLMMTGGYHSFGAGGHARSPLAGILPITPGRLERQRFGESLRKDVHLKGPVRMRIAQPFGARHPVMQIGANISQTWESLPPLDGANRLERRSLKPNAMVLAETDSPEALPLLVAGQPGEGRALAFAGDSTWKWTMAGQGESHRLFWRQAILWLAQKDDSKSNPVWLDLSARRVTRGAPLTITVGANPPEPQANQPIEFTTLITRPDRGAQQAQLLPDDKTAEGDFRATDLSGEYSVTVTAKQQDKTLGSATARFVVPDSDLELDRPGAEPTVMAQLAQITADAGGRSLAPEELPDLLAELAAQDPRVQEDVVARVTYWDTWPFFLLLVTLLCAEWYLRKRWGLV